MVNFSIIVAIDKHNGIGKNGGLAWRLKGDMKYFRNTTLHNKQNKMNIVIMGRKTWDSIPTKFRPLKNRINFIISRTLEQNNIKECENTMIFRSFKESLEWADSLYNLGKINNVFIIGGAQIYEEALNNDRCEKLYITEIDYDYECDCIFTKIDLDRFKLRENSKIIKEKDILNNNNNVNIVNYNFKFFTRNDNDVNN